jgi:hypothetical protein
LVVTERPVSSISAIVKTRTRSSTSKLYRNEDDYNDWLSSFLYSLLVDDLVLVLTIAEILLTGRSVITNHCNRPHFYIVYLLMILSSISAIVKTRTRSSTSKLYRNEDDYNDWLLLNVQ